MATENDEMTRKTRDHPSKEINLLQTFCVTFCTDVLSFHSNLYKHVLFSQLHTPCWHDCSID